jgi:CRISPR system Cascade subunit CasC
VKSSEGYVQKSIDKLFEEFKEVERFVRQPVFASYVTGYDVDTCHGIQAEPDLVTLLDKFSDEMKGLMPEKVE